MKQPVLGVGQKSLWSVAGCPRIVVDSYRTRGQTKGRYILTDAYFVSAGLVVLSVLEKDRP